MPSSRVIALAVLTSMAGGACAPPATAAEISRDHAIEIARKEVSFEPAQIDAVRAMSGMTPVWRVTLRGRLPGQPPELFQTVAVEINRRTGAIVSIARP